MAVKRNPCGATRETVGRLRAEYAAEKLAEYVAKVVDGAPPLTPAQRDRIAALLRGGAI